MKNRTGDIAKLLLWPSIGWLLFFAGYLLLEPTIQLNIILILSPALFGLLLVYILSKPTIQKVVRSHLDKHTKHLDELPDRQLFFWIALAAGLSLFIELMIIRIHSSYFQIFAYFKNISLLSCFLGLGIGYARGGKRPIHTIFVIPYLTIEIVFLHYLHYSIIKIQWLLKNPVVEQIAFGIDQGYQIKQFIMIYGFLILIFVFNTFCFVPLGQLASSLMQRKEELAAYSWNLIGSISGIILISFLSYLWCPPIVWFIFSTAGLMLFFHKDLLSFIPSLLSLVIISIILCSPHQLNRFDIFSPYQILSLTFYQPKSQIIELRANNTYHQRMMNLNPEALQKDRRLSETADYFNLPYIFKSNPQDVLIVGSGTGNDVAASVRNGAKHIDAVEIDPAILQFGHDFHPEQPYQADNVTTHVSDARLFIRHTKKEYDLIVYGLLDSHTLLSGQSGGIRLDSYVYTVEAFKEAKQKLKPKGLICLTFAGLREEIVYKLYYMLNQAFDGLKPVVFQCRYDGGITFVIGEGLKNSHIIVPDSLTNRSGEFNKKYEDIDKSTDNWPFLYMPRKSYPLSYLLMIVVLTIMSMNVISFWGNKLGRGLSIPCFFLGAGFMLIETKGITELALVLGSTWIVISIVIAAILTMAYFANLLVMKIGLPSPLFTYTALCSTLLIGYYFSYFDLGRLDLWTGRMMMIIVLTLPLFFSGFAFSTELKKCGSIAVALSSNLLGAMLGGFLEYNVMFFGFRSLYLFAIAMYLIAFLGSKIKTTS